MGGVESEVPLRDQDGENSQLYGWAWPQGRRGDGCVGATISERLAGQRVQGRGEGPRAPRRGMAGGQAPARGRSVQAAVGTARPSREVREARD